MKILRLELDEVYEIQLEPHIDDRGIFTRLFDRRIFQELGLPWEWAQENLSVNHRKGILRGLHFLLPPHTEGKLIRCARGRIWDVAVDLRKGSKTLGSHIANELHEDDFKWIYIPKGFAHGYCTLSDRAEVVYKHDMYYLESFDCGIRWDDPDLSIDWPWPNPVVSEKDSRLMDYSTFLHKYGGL